jgi:hypothetical protein
MDRRILNIFNAAILVAIIAIALLSWFYLRDQFMWGIILIIFMLMFASLVNVLPNLPRQKISAADVGVALAAVFILGFAWFYMRDQCMWAVIVVLLLLLLVGYAKLMRWLKDVVSVQVIVHKKGEDDDNKLK